MIEYALLGPLEVRIDGIPVDLGGARQRAVLAVLLVERNRIVSADRIIELVWGEDPPPTAETALQGHISRLRQLLGRDVIRTERPGYVIEVPAGAVDAERLESAIRAAQQAPDESAAGALRAVLEPAGGPPLDGIEIGAIGAAEIQRLDQLRLTALETLLDVELGLGRTDVVLAELERLVAVHPYHERFHGQRMLALYRAGRQADALAAYQAAREALDESLGIDPGPDLQELERRILVQDPDLDWSGPRPVSNLPSPPTVLVGRDSLVEDVLAIVEGGARIVTLTGPGGTGKTRLAIAVSSALAEQFPAGSWWIPCASLTDPNLVLGAIAGTIQGSGSVAERIGRSRVLIVVDSLEHLMPAAVDLARLIEACPNLSMIVTSRERLAIRAEVEVAVPALELDDAAALFGARARVEPDAVVRELCARLDALPLAIELAAARVKALTPGQILDRLSDLLDFLRGGPDLDPRQQTLRRTIDWSHEMLGPEERRAFRALARLPAGTTLDDAAPLLDADLDTLEALVTKSLVRFDAGRFVMLETIRAYGEERLRETGEVEALETRLASWALDLVTRQDALVRGPDQVAALARLEAELDNLRLAERVIVAAGDAERAGRFALAAAWWMRRRGRSIELLGWIRDALALPSGDPARRGWLLNEEILTTFDVDPGADLVPRIRAALELATELGDRALEASVLEQWSVVPPYDVAALERAGAIFRELDRANDTIRVAINLGSIELNLGRFDAAAERSRVALAMVRATGNDHGVGITLLNLGCALFFLDRNREAAAALREGLAALERVDDHAGLAQGLLLGAAIVARGGDRATGRTLATTADAVRARIQITPDENDLRLQSAIAEALGGEPTETVERLPLPAALARLRDALDSDLVERDVPSPR